jgi:hypothetical protein
MKTSQNKIKHLKQQEFTEIEMIIRIFLLEFNNNLYFRQMVIINEN